MKTSTKLAEVEIISKRSDSSIIDINSSISVH